MAGNTRLSRRLDRIERVLAAAIFAFLLVLNASGSGRLHFVTPEYVVHVWETKDGLPENSATSMAQTLDGYLWFGTFNGLVRFDGVTIKVFDQSKIPQLPSAAIINLYTDKTGRLWVSTELGMACLTTNGVWRRLGKEQGWTGNYAKSFTENKKGQIICGTDDRQIFRLTEERAEKLPVPDEIPQASLFCHFDSEGVLWLAGRKYLGRWVENHWERVLPAEQIGRFKCAAPSHDGGLWFFEMEHLRKFVAGKETERLQLPEQADPWSLFEDSQGIIWLSTYYNGIFRYKTGAGWSHYSSTNGLTYNAGRFVFEDDAGIHWVGTSGGGLHRFKARVFQSFAPDGDKYPLGRVIKSVYEIEPNRFLASTYGEGILNFENGVFSKAGFPNGIFENRTNCFPTPYVSNVSSDSKGNLWIGSIDGLYIWDRKSKPELALSNWVTYAILRDKSERMWVGGTNGLMSSSDGRNFVFYGTETGLSARNIRCLADDPKNHCLWIGTDDGGLFRHQNGSFRRFSQPEGMNAERIRSLHIDPAGVLWIGTLDKGLWRYANGRFGVVAEGKHLLPARQINAILEDDNGFLWMGSNKGIIRAHRQDLEAVVSGGTNFLNCQWFDYNDGLLSVEVPSGNQNCGVRDSAGRLWFCTMNGLGMVDPAKFKNNAKPPRILLQSMVYHVPAILKSGNESSGQRRAGEVTKTLEAPFAAPLILPSGSRRIEFNYAGLDYSAPEKLIYQYKLDGQDDDWIDADGRREAYYHDLQPGRYRFRVRAIDKSRIASPDEVDLAFSIDAFFWHNRWFQGLLLLLFGMGVAAVVDTRNRSKILQKTREAALTQHASDVVTLLNSEGVIIYESPSASNVLGYPKDFLLGKNPLDFIHQEDLPLAKQCMVQIMAKTNPGVPVSFRFRQADNGWIFVESVAANLLDQPGVNGILITTRNVSERKKAEDVKARLESQLRQAQKMEALGTLAGGIAHDFNNMLAVISGFTELAKADAPDKPEIQDSLNQIAMASNRATDLVKQILAFARQGKSESKPLRIQIVIKECLKLLGSTLPSAIEIVSDIETKPLVVHADPTQIHQVMMNLCINAAHAMQGKSGRLSVTLDTFEVEPDFATKHPELKPGPHARLVVSDTGHGMNEATLKRIFDPFFTTKAQGEGTGLGLAVVHGIVKDHEGAILVESKLGIGTTFQLFFPTQPEAAAPEEKAKVKIPHGHGELILYVDDEPALCESACLLLQNLGYTVTASSQPTKALARFREQPNAFDLVITDLSMPGMSGMDFAMELIKMRPDLPIILTSGFVGDWTSELAKSAGIREIVLKPVTSDRLGVLIDLILHSKSG